MSSKVNIIHNIHRCRPEIIKRFGSQGSATVHEAMGRKGAVDPSIKPIAKGMRICGSAFTVQCSPRDNLMLVKAISIAQPGDIIIADMGSNNKCGPFGEVLATDCQARQLGGLAVTCGVRDSQEIIEMGFPVFSNGLCIQGTMKNELGYINHPITFGGIIVNPGDIVLGDDDGIVIIPRENAEAVLEASIARVAKEDAVKARLRAGETLFDIYGYQNVFDRLGGTEE